MSLGTGLGLAYFVPLHVVQFIHIQGLGVPRGACSSNSCSGQFFFFPISAVKCSNGFIWLLGKLSEVQALSVTRRMYVDGLSAVSEINQQNHQSLGWFPAPVLWTTEAFQSSPWLVCGMVLNTNAHSLQLKFLFGRVCGSLQENLRSEGYLLPESSEDVCCTAICLRSWTVKCWKVFC